MWWRLEGFVYNVMVRIESVPCWIACELAFFAARLLVSVQVGWANGKDYETGKRIV